jgi:hypothetical protein
MGRRLRRGQRLRCTFFPHDRRTSRDFPARSFHRRRIFPHSIGPGCVSRDFAASARHNALRCTCPGIHTRLPRFDLPLGRLPGQQLPLRCIRQRGLHHRSKSDSRFTAAARLPHRARAHPRYDRRISNRWHHKLTSRRKTLQFKCQ